VERAAAREERRTRNEYRRAARKHAWRKWWRGNWRDQERIDDYEEKRSLIQHQESVLEEVMQEEIRQLREVHGVVNDLVSQAEEGRVVTYPHNYSHCSH
jgi:flagellar motility protein MotE (MotC chaperone)